MTICHGHNEGHYSVGDCVQTVMVWKVSWQFNLSPAENLQSGTALFPVYKHCVGQKLLWSKSISNNRGDLVFTSSSGLLKIVKYWSYHWSQNIRDTIRQHLLYFVLRFTLCLFIALVMFFCFLFPSCSHFPNLPSAYSSCSTFVSVPDWPHLCASCCS